MAEADARTVWQLLHDYAAAQSGTFTPQEALSWFRRHAPSKANDRTVRTHIRGACWNVGDRSQFARREPFLTRLDRGLFRRATPEEIASWSAIGSSGAAENVAQPVEAVAPSEGDWHTEEHIQHLLVQWLQQDGWTILRTADTAAREHGVDVVAERDGARLGVEVKGYPSRVYAAGPKKGEPKPTPPSSQAKHWFAHALVPAMRLRTVDPEARSVMCFPAFPVYRSLYGQTASSLRAAGIEVWLVTQAGQVEHLP